MKVIKNEEVVEDGWHLVGDDDAIDDHAIVSLERWNAERSTLAGREVGVVLRSDEEAADITDPRSAAIVAIDFPAFTDGRGYTSARRLREQFGYEGELRAVGDVLPDQLFYMRRCGIDSFALKQGKSFDDALKALGAFSVTYQAAADDPRPLFRRVAR